MLPTVLYLWALALFLENLPSFNTLKFLPRIVPITGRLFATSYFHPVLIFVGVVSKIISQRTGIAYENQVTTVMNVNVLSGHPYQKCNDVISKFC